MPSASQRILLDFFQKDLNFTPTAGQVDQFESDLALVSPSLMRAALKEAKAGKALQQGTFAEKRAAILAIYYRKVAEHAQLFPIFHTFETAFRSLVAVELEALYAMADWWRPIFNVLLKGDQAESIKQIKGVALSRNSARRIGEIIYAIEGINLQRNVITGIKDGYEFAELCDLSHISSLITNHWSHFSPRYFNIAPRIMTQQEFSAKFTKVRDARNDIYHHKSLARMANVVTSAEELLERLNCSLALAYDKITNSRVVAPKFAITQTAQHNLW